MDVISLPVEYHNDKIDGRFRFVNIAAQRAKELTLGAEPKIETQSIKVTTIAIEETAQGVIDFLTGEEAAKAEEEARKLDFRRLLEESNKEPEAEDLAELEKDLKIYLHDKESGEGSESSDESLITGE
ncbi:DNA-directed RNA polymerase subunit omega [bacterium BMS3Bbin06]|nr:DNA-directed RNA polymerase subunit omega [bacterium BMS3Abin08]GBE35452.1 DNA-directed RNA polymerase subunit omega [bacterium BMS3Bbin06]HDH00199.1 DNA-directed RNA polymerase subunit omega [Nitrospirota bacterium]HDO35196.1 DNA-directed RNA polymerase subunit omega [Nitrospirota bacterium]HDY71431.1 DNA-directed RNA polymerase subunit omega [Nitrospirota bacterium]